MKLWKNIYPSFYKHVCKRFKGRRAYRHTEKRSPYIAINNKMSMFWYSRRFQEKLCLLSATPFWCVIRHNVCSREVSGSCPLCGNAHTARTIFWDSIDERNCTYLTFFSKSGVYTVKINAYEGGPPLYSLLAHAYLDFFSLLPVLVSTQFLPPWNLCYYTAARPFVIVRLVLLSAVRSPQHLANMHSKVKGRAEHMHTLKWKVVFMWLWLWSDSNQLCIPGHTQEMCLNFLSLPVHSSLFQQKVFD